MKKNVLITISVIILALLAYYFFPVPARGEGDIQCLRAALSEKTPNKLLLSCTWYNRTSTLLLSSFAYRIERNDEGRWETVNEILIDGGGKLYAKACRTVLYVLVETASDGDLKRPLPPGDYRLAHDYHAPGADHQTRHPAYAYFTIP